MNGDEARCEEVRRIEAIDAAFRAGDLRALRARVDDPGVIPNGSMPLAIGPCLVYAVYHSPLPFIRELLALGADPDRDDGDGFPPLFAALCGLRARPGAPGRTDALEVLALLLEHGADPDRRGINDWTPLHMAVSQGSAAAVRVLLAHGADPSLRTRIDDCDSPREYADTLGLSELSRLLADAERR
jgi:ankyrin repeat protein